ncbi:MAG: Dolichyl-phosphate beta-D-mannosyltransferase [uncultured bacterium]|nr:MAG: Dolichyl-phosphate beta-D-mannosyltransferase [uncultured bacterium]KKT75215.1 MAG: hypothetical protein UW70_C0037G0029 [Candidatus Peregrinibacteria bacterium GW2011_GWA2_44_7]
MDLSIILPTYNEKEAVVELIQVLLSSLKSRNINPEIIVVDDNSPDETGLIVKEKFKDVPNVRCIIRKERGLATATRRGIEEASSEIILLMDADFNHDPHYVPQMYEILKKYDYDAVNGSRYVWGGDMHGPRGRYYGSYTFNMFLNLLLFIQTQDNTGIFFMFRKKLISHLNMKAIFNGYGDFFMRLLYALKLLKIKLIEIPVVYKERHSGKSKTFFYKYLFQYTWTAIKIRFSGKTLIH